MQVLDALKAAGVDEETVAMVAKARSVDDVFAAMVTMLVGTADQTAAKNYGSFEIHGSVLPFERIYVEALKPGGKTSHELRELLRRRLDHVKRHLEMLDRGDSLSPATVAGLISGIDDDLKLEAP